MERIGVEERVATIERAFRRLDGTTGTSLRLRGAACFLELASTDHALRVHGALHDAGVLALQRGPTLGFWPPATITADHLDHVVGTTEEALERCR